MKKKKTLDMGFGENYGFIRTKINYIWLIKNCQFNSDNIYLLLVVLKVYSYFPDYFIALYLPSFKILFLW